MDMLLFQLEKNGEKPLYDQLYSGIKEAIITNKIAVGEKLPSKRKLADFLNISQTTIEIAYAQLLAEGYIMSKSRVGYFVEEIDELPYIQQDTIVPLNEQPKKKSYKIDFNPGSIDIDAFPFQTWRKYAKELFDDTSKELLLTGEPQGELSLRTEIANYLFQSRGVVCSPEQIVIGSGTEQLLPMILRLFSDNTCFALENPGYPAVHRMFSQHKRKVYPIAVDDEGIIIHELEKTSADVVYITPSHQFPTGAVLSATRRAQALNWAAQSSSRYIIEDDYDSEFRYTGKPIPALHALDRNDKVIYMSTFTKSLMPSLRVAYFVLPTKLLATYNDVFNYYSSTVPRFDQHIVANFMHDGHFAKHLNRMRKVYRKKHEKLTSILENYSNQIKITGEQAGMHILLDVQHALSEKQLQQLASNAEIGIYPLSDYRLDYSTTSQAQFLLGFGGIPVHEIEPSIEKLMDCWDIQKKHPSTSP
ncbi:PLP-dependent aminotransferase family protein [Lysinibacillus agricola]|uniref:PLP-dependent aminotransferase family protein n=1 Tax=Lysinibacillus agricola TaxID=2590012 RepID=A0ABX7ASF8_9BACI|nr:MULTISPECIES: PLP-dependent aminotransferase family protein [Lysinibacillus]QQP12581.1 PLP-dependent aminotransferase family protein [Lysinibacillus agricola]